MIKVRQNVNAVSAIENKEIQKLTNDLKKEFKALFDIKIKLENENKKLKALLNKQKSNTKN